MDLISPKLRDLWFDETSSLKLPKLYQQALVNLLQVVYDKSRNGQLEEDALQYEIWELEKFNDDRNGILEYLTMNNWVHRTFKKTEIYK